MTPHSELLFIDPAVSDIATLLGAVRPDVETVVLDAVRPAVQQLAEALTGRSNLAVHIIAHGAPGLVRFASGDWSTTTLAEHASDLAVIGEALGKNGGLRLWSCEAPRWDGAATGTPPVRRSTAATSS